MVRLEFEQEEDDSVHAGFVEKAFRGAKGTVLLEYEGQSITDPAMADQVLAELTGIPTEAFFRSTASVRHHEVDDLARDEAALRDRLQASISWRRPGHEPGSQEARPGPLRAEHQGREEPRPPEDRRGGGHPDGRSGRERRGGPGSAGARSRPPGSRPGARAGGRRGPQRAALDCSRRPARRSASSQSARPPRSASSATATAVQVSDEIATLHDTHPARDPLPVLRTTVGRLRDRGHADPRAEGDPVRRGRGQVRRRPARAAPGARPRSLALLLILAGIAGGRSPSAGHR